MYRLSHALILALAFSGLFSCEAFDKPEADPGYLAFQNPKVELDTITGFTSTTGVRNVWIYYAGLLHAVVRTPQDSSVVIPIIDEGRNDFVFEGGIFETGQSAFNVPYPFWQPVNLSAQVVGLDTLVIEPTYSYIEPKFYDFIVKEDFEGGSMDLVPFASGLSGDSTFMRIRNNSDVFQGNGMGYVNFGAGDQFFEAISANTFQLIRGRTCYAEITYKNSVPFQVGLLYQNADGIAVWEIMTITPSSEWNTVYVNLISYVRQIINAGGENTVFWLWMKADGSGENGYIQMDDLRILQMKN